MLSRTLPRTLTHFLPSSLPLPSPLSASNQLRLNGLRSSYDRTFSSSNHCLQATTVESTRTSTPSIPPGTKRRPLRATKAAITLTPDALSRLKALLVSPTPQLVRISVKNKGCAGMSYHLEYVIKPEKFDEIVEQDGVKVIVDSKALFSIIGSEMDWQEDALMSKFVFKNPNVTDECGCGESFTV